MSAKTECDEIHARGPADYVVCGDEDGSCSMDRPCEAREMPGAYKAPEKICSTARSPKPPVPPISRRTGYEMESYVPDGRKLYVVDAENIAGGSDVHPRIAQKMVSSIFSGVPCQADIDHIVVACGITFAKTCFGVLLDHNWPKRPHVLPFASGIDGADIRLIKHIDEVQRIAGRYSQIIIGSGDGIFQTAAISFRAVGVTVGVVSRLSALSNELARAADWVVHIPEPKHELTRGSISA